MVRSLLGNCRDGFIFRLESMHFIVTGGAGFIGSHLTEQLLIEGYDSTSTEKILKDPG